MTTEFHAAHFAEPSDLGAKVDLFRSSIEAVILEVTAHCNRRCRYCPVSLAPRLRADDVMPDAVLDKVERDLASIAYDRSICLNLYNEPLGDRPKILATIRRFRRSLPNACIYFSTNGDYLDRPYLDALVDSGLSKLVISIHTAPSKRYDKLEAMSRMTEIAVSLECSIRFSRVEENDAMGELQYNRIPVMVFSRDFELQGVDRGGTMRNVSVPHKRTSPCNRPFDNFTVDYRGNIFPCCMFNADIPSSAQHATGKLSDYDTIFDAYASQRLAEWRKSSFPFGDKASPCDTCLLEEEPATAEAVAERNRAVRGFRLLKSSV
jgi:sulfatase maturation enzyme AslB (radical SAM superfamily)